MRRWRWAASSIWGALGWSGASCLLPFGLGMIVVWRLSRTRVDAFGAALCYYGVASFPMVESAATLFEPAAARWGFGVALWLGGNVLLSSVWAGFWSRSVRTDVSSRLSRGTLCAALLALPPVGLIGWANPWNGTGILLPGAGFSGLALLQLVMLGSTRKTLAVHLTALLLAIAVTCGTYEGRVADPAFGGLSTSFGEIALADTGKHFEMAFEVAQWVRARDERVLLLPEGVGGVWTPSTALLWETALSGIRSTVLVGALDRTVGGYRNGLVVASENGTWFWPQRVPAPIGMWAPWSDAHVRSNLFGRAIYTLQGKRATLLMCFEQLIAWPAIQSAIVGADIALAPANLWFARGTRVNAIRAASLRSWARLFDWALVEAVNE